MTTQIKQRIAALEDHVVRDHIIRLEAALDNIKIIGTHATAGHDKPCHCATCELTKIAKIVLDGAS